MAPTSELTSLRYSAPTCTLEVMGELSPLSQVAAKPILKRLRFELQIRPDDDNPTVPPVAQVRGMRSHLLALSNAVRHHVQNHLNTPVDSPLAAPAVSLEGISLEAESLTRHRLNLGNLVPRNQPQQVRLNLSQLADLAEVLDQFEAAVALLPAELTPSAAGRRRRASFQQFPWVNAAAAGLLVAVGAGAVLTSVLNSGMSPQAGDSAVVLENAPQSSPEYAPSLPPDAGVDAAPGTAPEAPAQGAAPPESFSAQVPSTAPEVSPGSAGVPTAPRTGPEAPAAGGAPPNGAAKAPAVGPPPQSDPFSQTQPTLPPDTARTGGGSNPAALSAPPAPAAESGSPQGSPLASADPAVGTTANAQPDLADQATALETLRRTLQQQWQPPADLSAPLVYILIINEAGRLQSVEPQSAQAETYRDRIPFPPLGTALTSPRDTAWRVRLTLLPTGEVTLL